MTSPMEKVGTNREWLRIADEPVSGLAERRLLGKCDMDDEGVEPYYRQRPDSK